MTNTIPKPELEELIAEWDEKAIVGEPGASVYAQCAQDLTEVITNE